MKHASFILILIFASQVISAQQHVKNQYATVDRTALQIPDSLTKTTGGISNYINSNFQLETEKARAIFIWIASNIQYDVDNMFAINFYEQTADKITKPLKSRKGICENYAALFTDICKKSGIKSYLIEGYTKQNGFAEYIPHAWCAAQIDSSWFMFDPTWGSGYMENSKFIPKINNSYFKVNPWSLIKTHMPFDFLWQFLNYPVTNQEFYEGKTQQNKSKPFFSYIDSISVNDNLGPIEQMKASVEKIQRNGVKNSLIYDRLQHLRLEIENNRQNQIVSLYNAAVSECNLGISFFNEFIQYRNKQFTPKKTDPEIQNMIDASENKLKAARIKLSEIQIPDSNTAASMLQLTKTIDDVARQVKEQQDWLKVYFSKGKSARKSMFYERKIMFFGMPAN
jgi:hypothetical protein